MARKANRDFFAFWPNTFVLGQVLFAHVQEAQIEECEEKNTLFIYRLHYFYFKINN